MNRYQPRIPTASALGVCQISYTEGKCRRCGHDIKPRYKGRHLMGMCHQCRMKELAQMTKGVR